MLKLSFRQSQSEVMVRAASTVLFNSLVRDGYPIVPLLELAEHPQYGFTTSASLENIGPKFVRITDLQDGRINWADVPYCKCDEPENYLLQENDLLFARTGATTGKTHLVQSPPPAVFASYLIRVRAKKEINPEYLYSFFQSDLYWSQVISEKEGSAQPNVNGQKLMSLRLPLVSHELQSSISEFIKAVRARQDGSKKDLPELPHPLTAQRRIVVRIEELAAKIEEARGLRRESSAELDAVTGRAAIQSLKALSAEQCCSIEEIAEVRGGIQKGPHRIAGENPVRYLTVAHVHRNRILLSDPRFFEVLPEELERWRLEAGDVLIIEGNGSADQIGRTALFRGEIENCVHQNHVIRIRPNKELIDPEFLNLYLNSPLGQDEVQSLSRTTSGLRTLSVGRIKQITVPVPLVEEQHRIVAYLDHLQAKVDALKQLQAETAAELDALLPSVLDRAFRGAL